MLKLEQENLGGEKIESLSTEIEKSSSKINELETENKFVLFVYISNYFSILYFKFGCFSEQNSYTFL